MAEQIIVLMADWDDETQKALGGIYEELAKEGFSGRQTKHLPYHISMSTFLVEKEAEALEAMKKAASLCGPVQVSISHIGVFAGGEILFAAPDRNEALEKLHEACDTGLPQEFAWTPHTTIIIDEPEVVQSALPTVVKGFRPLSGKITRLHLCAFWPTREIATIELTGEG
jgi:2'-5' RNA ligase